MIKMIKWNNHPILGNLALDFTKTDGSCYNTIVLAGENGSGKTTILETLSAFLNLESIEPFEYIKYIVDNNVYTIKPSVTGAKFGFHTRTNEADNTTVSIQSNKNNNKDSIANDPADLRYYGCSYSKARSGFSTQKVKTTTTQQVDASKYEDDAKEDFTSIKQLIVNIDEQDNSEWMSLCKSGTPPTFEDFHNSCKLHRFEKAFNDFFDKMTFFKVDTTDSEEKKILFEKNEKKISIDNLSTGEKQIAFRGTHLLKNHNNLNGGTILIDEPELSMHPKWQGKILQYYRNLFTKNNEQTSQIIIATHSEYVLRTALEDKDNVLIITLNEGPSGEIKQTRITAPSVLPTITAAETNYLAFGIISIDYHIQLYGYLQNKENKTSIKDCDNFIVAHTLYDPTKHAKVSSFTNKGGHTTTYQTLPTYIRNAIDHPDSGNTYTAEELKLSTELLINLCK